MHWFNVGINATFPNLFGCDHSLKDLIFKQHKQEICISY